MTSKQLALLAISIVLLTSSCRAEMNQAAPTSTAFPVTSTFPVLSVLPVSETPLPSPSQPTVTPVEGTTSTQINVRSEPSTSGSILGMIPANAQVQIVGKDPGGNWWQILYEGGAEGKGWVTAQYVSTIGADSVPVIGGNPSDPGSGNVAIVQEQINVRSGPGTSFNSLGTLNAQDVVSLTGKDSNGTWLQIAFEAGPEGKGWVNAAFVRAQGVEYLPIITEAGQIVGTGTPTAVPAAPTPTILPAWTDNDSSSNPVVSVIFERAGTQTLIYDGDVSTPLGDPEDWINFGPYTGTVLASLSCVGNGSLQAEILEDGTLTSLPLTCGDLNKPLTVKAGAIYSVHLYTQSTASFLQYARYAIKIQTGP